MEILLIRANSLLLVLIVRSFAYFSVVITLYFLERISTMMKRLNRIVTFVVCIAIIILALSGGQNTVKAADFFSTEASAKVNIPEYAIGNFLA